MGAILYVGGFVLPDRNAAAQRVLSIAKGLRKQGKKVYFLNYSEDAAGAGWTAYQGFECYECPRRSMWKQLTDILDAEHLIHEKKITAVIAYNYPAAAMWRLIRFCKARGVRCYADATEWYVARGNLLFRIIKTLDTELRMRLLQPRMDGVIAISAYLYSFYCNRVPTVQIPPTVDLGEAKWEQAQQIKVEKRSSGSERTEFVYAGSPDAQKERLDRIVRAADAAAQRHPLHLNVVGITKQQYEAIYGCPCGSPNVTFCGRVSHSSAVRYVAQADWSIVIRDNNQVVKAGFPTKVVESISCGTPVLANRFSNIADYLGTDNSLLCDMEQLTEAMEQACMEPLKPDRTVFSYENYLEELNLIEG